MTEAKWKINFRSHWNRKGYTFLQFLLDGGLDVNARNKHGKTMLSYAALWGNLEIANFLLQEGADGEVSNSDGSKPLHVAAEFGHKDIVRLFLKRGLSADSRDNSKCTTLHYVAECDTSSVGRESYQEIVHLLIDSNADLNALNRFGETPLLRASTFCRWNIVEMLIKLGADVNCRNNDQYTALHYCCRNGWLSMVRRLVEEFDVDANAITSKGDTPMLLAAARSEREIVELLIEVGARVDCCNERRWTVLHYASWIGWLAIVRSLVEARFNLDLNARTSEGDTAVLLAAGDSHKDVVELFIKLGANVNHCNKNQKMTLLHHSSSNGWVDIVKHLVNSGCDINAKDGRGHTPLISAARESHSEIVKYFIQCGAHLECCDDIGCTVLHYVCREGWLDLVKSLINMLSDINVQAEFDDTPLHYAVRAQHTEIVEHLLKAGANCNLKNYSGQTAFSECISCVDLEEIKLFIEYGAYIQLLDYYEIFDIPFLKEGVLQNTTLCTQSVVNQFNNADLPEIYEIPAIAEMLPPIDNLKIACQSQVFCDIAKSVNFEIQTKGHCDMLNARPIFLSSLCVRSLLQ